ncbi:MAG: hypothetical protein IT353_06225 [Gemmatimonadaceae bacterium]|nr:hypothetical protein [Gemmatimonadaceae bacterium]
MLLTDPTAAAAAPTNPIVSRIRRIDVKHIDLDLRFDWARKRVMGRAVLTFAPLQSTRSITLDAGMLSIASVTLANGTPLAFRYDGSDRDDGLAITLDRVRPAHEDMTIAIRYETRWVNESDPNNLGGSNGKGIRFFEPTFTERHKRRQIWSMGYPTGNRYWFPSYDAPDDLRTTTLSATVPKPLSVVSNGTLVHTVDNGDDTRTYQWHTSTPYANHLTAFIAGEYREVVQQVGPTTLRSIGYPDEYDAVAASVVRLPDMMRFFASLTGVAYPFASYTQVFAQDKPWGVGGMMMSTMTENMVDDAPTHADYFYLWDGLEAEGLASQWFGAYLTPREWSDAWLVRGFPHYLDEMYSEHKNGREEFLYWNLAADHATYHGDWQAGARHPVAAPFDSAVVDFANDNYPFTRGALVLHMLRKELGDDTFNETVRCFVATAQSSGRMVTTDDLRRAAEQASGRSLGWFFGQWVYGIGHPKFVVTKQFDSSSRQLTLTLEQAHVPDTTTRYAQARYFAGHMDITIDDRVERVWIDPAAKNVFTFAMASAPKLVGFDREATWIKEVTFEKSLDELLYQAEHDSDALGQRSAMSALSAIGRRDSTSAAIRSRIQDLYRRVINGDRYWRVRLTALASLQGMLTPSRPDDAAVLDEQTVSMLRGVLARDSAWMKAQAFAVLGLSRDQRFVDLYLEALYDRSHPVSYAAATALGQSKSPKAYAALTTLMTRPSWKGENKLSGLIGLTQLGDPRAVSVALNMLADESAPRWYLATPRWDYRLAAADLRVARGKSAAAYPLIAKRFDKSLEEDDVNDMFSNLYILAKLGDRRADSAIAKLRTRFKDDANALNAVNAYEKQLQAAGKP